jgi:phage/plasmid-like protein (TIGR03299 family)
MAHNFDTGFTVRTPAWHGLGVTLDEYPDSWAEARKHAGLIWEPAEDVIYRRVRIDAETAALIPGVVPTGDPEVWMAPLANHKLITRNDSGAELSVQRTEWPIIHHSTMGDLLDAVADEAGASFRFETAGSLQGGRKVWALARLDEPYQIPGDDSLTFPYFAMQNAHDGEGACRIIPTQVRIVCQNTWQLASTEADRHGFEVVIRHIGDPTERIEQAKATLSNARAAAANYANLMTDLAGLNYTDGVVETFLERMIPTPELATPRLIAERDERRNLCRAMLAQSPTLAPLPDTAYKLVQLVGEYTDHLRGLPENDDAKRKDVYLRRVMFKAGPGSQIKADVIDCARELCTEGRPIMVGV